MDLVSSTSTVCPKCGEPATDLSARFCEACGASFGKNADEASSLCASCGAGADDIDDSGFCTQCGLERHRQTETDHWEINLSPRLAGVCDLGVKRLANEDSLALAEANSAQVLIVCDGISQTRNAGAAASAAAPVVRDALLAASGESNDLWKTAMHEALKKAHRAVAAVTVAASPSDDAPAATIVAALVRKQEVVLGWLGDCRAYWIGDAPGDARLLTKDHSWVNEVVDAGKLTYAEAQTRRGAHAVTRSLGGPPADSSSDDFSGDEPSILYLTLDRPGWLLLCSDGLWNYASEPAEIATWIRDASNEKISAMELARTLIRRARTCGGRDNITAALLRLN